MGMYSETIKIDVSYKYVYRVAFQHGLPMPREMPGETSVMYFTATDVKQWNDEVDRVLALSNDIDYHLYHIARVMSTHAQDYIHKVGRTAPQGPPRKRLKYFQRQSKKYRLMFF